MRAPGPHPVEDVADEGGLRLVDVDDGVHAVGIRPVKHEEVGVARRQRAQVRLGPVAPVLAQVASTGSEDVDARQIVGGLETGAVDDGVDAVFDAVGGAYPALGDLGDRSGFQPHVGQREGGIPPRDMSGRLQPTG